MTVAAIHALASNRGGWVLFIEGLRYGFTNVRALAGTGVGSWIGTAYGDREILLGLRMPSELPLGDTDPWSSKIEQPRAVTFGLLDFEGLVAQIFRALESDATTDSMGSRLSPLDDPAPATVPGAGGTPVDIWGRHVGIEAIGPAGQRRYYWCTPSTPPPGLDHPAGIDLPPTRITDTPTIWAGRKITVYRVVQDPTDETWPSWEDQHNGGSLRWYGTLRDDGKWTSTDQGGRMLSLSVFGLADWLRKSIGLARPSVWHQPSAGITLTGDQVKVAAWIGSNDDRPRAGDGLPVLPGTWEVQTLASGNTLAGLTSRAEIVQRIRDIVQAMISGADSGPVLAATNATYTGPGPAIAQAHWQFGDVARDVVISPDGSTLQIKCEVDSGSYQGFELGLALDVEVWQLLGWDIDSLELAPAQNFGYTCPVGGSLWGENPEDATLPQYHYIGVFSTWDRVGPLYEGENAGKWQIYTAPYPAGTVTLQPEGGTLLRLGVGEIRCEGQLGQPYTFGSQIDGTDCDASGWWLFRGQRITAAAYLAGEDPEDFVQVALCEWVATSDGDGIEVDSEGFAAIRVIRFEDPRAFALPYDRIEEPWVSVAGSLECAPISVLGGIGLHVQAPSYRNRLIPSILLSSGTATFLPGAGVVDLVPGVNHPGDLPPGDPWAGDVEVADLGLGLPVEFVDWASWYDASSSLPGGAAGALNRCIYPIFGVGKLEGSRGVLVEAMAGAGLAWSCKRPTGGVVPAFGAYDPLRTLSLADVEVTLRRSDMAEMTSALTDDGPMWRGEVDFRDGGPYDRFEFEVSRDPLDGDLAYSLTYESADDGRRFRDGKITWSVVDGGLRDPSLWLGTPWQPLYDWTGLARERFSIGYGQTLARQRRMYSNTYNDLVGQHLGLGTVVRVIDPTAESPDGLRGLDHLGRVRSASIISRGTGNLAVRVMIELQGRSTAVRMHGPGATSGVGQWDSGTSTMTVSEDYAGVGDGHSDVLGFVQPPWADYDDEAMRVAIYQSEDGVTYPAGLDARADVLAVDDATQTLLLGNISGTIYRDTIKLIVGAPWDEQTAAWVLALYMPITEPDGTFDGAKGYRLG